MKIIQKNLSTNKYQTKATLTGYLQTPVPKSPVQQFRPLIFVPGGSMTHIPVEQSEKTALSFSASGFQVFILRYTFTSERQPVYPNPLIDLALAVAMIRNNAEKWHLKADQLTIMGFSAGGHVAALYNDYWHEKWLSKASNMPGATLKPNAVILGYPVIDLNLNFPKDVATRNQWTDEPERYNASMHVNAQNAPTFMWTTFTDQVVSVQNTLNYSQALLEHQISQELHVFAHGPHGMDIANAIVAHHDDVDQPHVAHWVELACEWIDDLFE